jgi:hypothetical protein
MERAVDVRFRPFHNFRELFPVFDVLERKVFDGRVTWESLDAGVE